MIHFDKKKLLGEIRREEGSVIENGRHVIYKDHLGYETIGYGRLITERRGGGISEHEANLMLENDVNRVVGELDYHLKWFSSLTDTRQRALINMAFQLGTRGLMGFKKALRALEKGDYRTASIELLDSRWAVQTPERAKRMAEMILVG